MRIPIRRSRRGAAFVHPLDPAPRTAILAAGFGESDWSRVFPEGWTESAMQFRPTSAAGKMAELRKLAKAGLQLEHAVIAFTTIRERLTERDREFLWRAFGVPVFEQCLGPENELVAMECEAHDGVHLLRGRPVDSGEEMESSTCACGSDVPRLIDRKRAVTVAGIV